MARYKIIADTFYLCELMSVYCRNTWRTVKEIYRIWIENVSSCHWRTIQRMLRVLVEMGIVEAERRRRELRYSRCSSTVTTVYRWVGYPNG